jgi:vacuolar protein sorting-associated protein 18
LNAKLRIHLNAASTKEVILGTQNGQLFEMAVDEAEKREKYVKQLFELNDPREPITGLQVQFAYSMLASTNHFQIHCFV